MTHWTDLYLTEIADHMVTPTSSMIRCDTLGQIFIWLKLQITWLHLPHQQWGVTRWTDLYLTKTANHTVTPTSSMMRCDTLDSSLSDWNCKSHSYTYLINDKVWHVGQIFIRLKLPQNHTSGAVKQTGEGTFARLEANLVTTEIVPAILGGFADLLRHTVSQTGGRDPAWLGDNDVTLWPPAAANTVLQDWSRQKQSCRTEADRNKQSKCSVHRHTSPRH